MAPPIKPLRTRGLRPRDGRFGAEIRNPIRKARVWLGTFDMSEQAARAYDATVRRFRGAAAITHYPNDGPAPVLAPISTVLWLSSSSSLESSVVTPPPAVLPDLHLRLSQRQPYMVPNLNLTLAEPQAVNFSHDLNMPPPADLLG
jgi:EREBP-like factor